ncbi:MAG: hypothetical protein ACLQBA_00905 [Candidatus Binataceae bacterium]
MRDSVDLLKANGTTIAGLKANVHAAKKITMFPNAGAKLVVESGDLIRRKLSTGVEEIFRVIEPGFHEGFHGIPENYQMTVQKLDPAAAAIAIESIGDGEISEERRLRMFAQWEEMGVDFIKADLMDGGFRIVGGPPASRRLAHAWVRMKEAEQKQASEQASGHTFNVTGANSRVNFNSTDQSTNTVITSTLFNEIHKALDDGVQDVAERANLKMLLTSLEAASDQKSFVTKYQRFITAAADHVTILTPFLPALTALLTSFAS